MAKSGAGNAEELAEAYERGEIADVPAHTGGGGKRNKAEQVEHKHYHPEGDTRKIGECARPERR